MPCSILVTAVPVPRSIPGHFCHYFMTTEFMMAPTLWTGSPALTRSEMFDFASLPNVLLRVVAPLLTASLV